MTFSDRPTPGAEAVDVPPTSSYTPPSFSSSATAPAAAGDEEKGDQDQPQSLSVRSPADDEAVRQNAGNLPFSFEVKPAMKPGQTIRVLLDGLPIQESAIASGTLENLDRGTHVLSGELVGSDGRVIASSGTVEFHLLRVSGGGGLLR